MPTDELTERLRALEAERLRPVPEPPPVEFARRLDAFEKRLEDIGNRHHYGLTENDDHQEAEH